MTTTGTAPERPAPTTPPAPAAGWAAASGATAATTALGVGELVAGLRRGAASPVAAVGELVVDTAPGGVARAAIDLLGTADKPALLAGTVVVAVLLGAALGVLARSRPWAAAAAFAAFGVLGALAALRVDDAPVVPTLVGAAAAVAAGLAVLRALLRRAPAARTAAHVPVPAAGHGDRRSFLRLGGATLAGAGAATLVGRRLAARTDVAAERAAVDLPPPDGPDVEVPEGAELGVAGVAPFLTPNDAFYRIDTALRVPQVDPATWRLRIDGEVERPFSLGYEDLLALPQHEAVFTLACVSNAVGGDLVGNARWQGVRLADLLGRAGVRPAGTQVVGRSVDGFTVGFPTEVALDGRDALVAVAMNGEPLPVVHGFPARLVVPGLYGYVSATKWLEQIELVPLDAFDAYWVPRGWAKEAPVKTQSRIDVPADGASLPAGRQPVAGVAWAPTRGIERVEVRVDDGPWEEAELGAGVGDDTWRQWVWRWDAPPGRHTIAVRATDGTGRTQTAERADVVPDGATGHHTVAVQVG